MYIGIYILLMQLKIYRWLGFDFGVLGPPKGPRAPKGPGPNPKVIKRVHP